MTAKEGYRLFLQTDQWKKVSDLVKKRDGYRCRLCNSEERLTAHHRTYAHRGDEINHLGDLTTLCHDCHSAFHSWQQNSGKVMLKQAVVTLTASKIEKLMAAPTKRRNIIAKALGVSATGFRWIDLAGEIIPMEQWERLQHIANGTD